MRYLSVDEITALAMSVLEEANDSHRLIFKSWIYFAVREIGVTEEDIKICTVPIKNQSFKKPQDLISTVDIVLRDSTGADIPYKYSMGVKRIREDVRRGFYGSFFNPSDTIKGARVDLSEDNHSFHVSDDSPAVKATIRYYAAPIDENGEPLVPEGASQAILMYLRYMWSMRKNQNQARIEQDYRMYLQERDRAIGRLGTPSELRGEQIATEMNSMIKAHRRRKF